jgi:hypothetical protein
MGRLSFLRTSVEAGWSVRLNTGIARCGQARIRMLLGQLQSGQNGERVFRPLTFRFGFQLFRRQ